MSGPIVRSGPTPTYTKNWAAAFGKAKPEARAGKKAPAAKPAKKKSKS